MTNLRLSSVAAVLLALAAGPVRAQSDAAVADPCIVGGASKIELAPKDVASSKNDIFSTLPTQNPAVFGLTGATVRKVNFDVDPAGAALVANASLTGQYSSLGVTMNDIRIDSAVYGGPASPPNATEDNAAQIYTFTVPVAAAGIINTSPDSDVVELWSGPDATGTMLLRFQDQQGVSVNFNIDRFVGGRACPGKTIGSIKLNNASGDLELDELIFELAPAAADGGADAATDVAAGDASAGADAVKADTGGGNCECKLGNARSSRSAPLLPLLLGVALVWRRHRRR